MLGSSPGHYLLRSSTGISRYPGNTPECQPQFSCDHRPYLKGAQSEKELAAYGTLEGTLVFLMGLQNLDTIANGLIKGGKTADTPAAVIEDGSLDSQRVVRGTLANIYEKAAKAFIKHRRSSL